MLYLTEEQTEWVFKKLAIYVGNNLRAIVERPDGTYNLRIHKNRVYYMREDIRQWSHMVGHEYFISSGTCLGILNVKKKKFRLHITSLNLIAPFAKYKMWLKPAAEQSFLYGNNVAKSGLARISEATEKYSGVVIFNMNDIPLGFGVSAISTAECRRLQPTDIVCFHQADVGEYIRSEKRMFSSEH